MQLPDLQLRLKVDLIVDLGLGAVLFVLASLAHHDDRRLHRRHAGQHQVQKDEWIGIERAKQQSARVQGDPDQQDPEEPQDERPGSTEGRHPVGHALTHREVVWILGGLRDRRAANYAVEDFGLQRAKLSSLIRQERRYMRAPIDVEVGSADRPPVCPFVMIGVDHRAYRRAHEDMRHELPVPGGTVADDAVAFVRAGRMAGHG